MKTTVQLTIALLICFISTLSNAQTATPPSIGDGSVGNPYQISTLDHLYWITQSIPEWGKHYVQTEDIDAGETNTWDVGDHDMNVNTPDEPMGFTPIGVDGFPSGNPFIGSYNGKGHSISGIYINRPLEYNLGLFGNVLNASIDSLELIGVYINGYGQIGALIGKSQGTTVSNCSSTGTINASNNLVGGLIGFDYSLSITRCTSSAAVYGVTGVGGLIGGSYSAEITNCFSVGTVTGTGYYIGGFIGGNYAQSDVTNCYALGYVTATTDFGGFMGWNEGTVTNCFWDTYWGVTTSAAGTPKDHVEIKTLSTFTDATWDFLYETANGTNDYWRMPCGGDNYPRLAWQDNGLFSAFGTDTRTECGSFVWIDGNTYTTSNNTATYTLLGAAGGCDSIVQLDLTIVNSISDVTTSTTGETITANNATASYQWLDCDNNYAVIPGETGQSFTAIYSGNYAVEITENTCVDTSQCVAVTTSAGMQENDWGNGFTVYPNPTKGNFSLDLGTQVESGVVSIFDVKGELISTKPFDQIQVVNFTLDAPAGIYFLAIQTNNNSAFKRIVKE